MDALPLVKPNIFYLEFCRCISKVWSVFKNPDEVYNEPTKDRLAALETWFLSNVDHFIGSETGIHLSFLAETWNMVSIDQGNPGIGANQIGQQWIVDTWFYNR